MSCNLQITTGAEKVPTKASIGRAGALHILLSHAKDQKH
jgi:hypothetical protein